MHIAEIAAENEDELLEKVKIQAEKIREKAGISLKRGFPIIDCR